MIKKEDLFSGAWLRSKVTGAYAQVKEIKGGSFLVLVRQCQTKQSWFHLDDDWEYVPLSDDVLSELGFVREGAVSHLNYGTFSISVLHRQANKLQLVIYENEHHPMINVSIRFLHQLQLAFKLCEIDKEIRLKPSSSWQH